MPNVQDCVILCSSLDTDIPVFIEPFGLKVLEYGTCQVGIANLECEELGFDRINLLIPHCWEMHMSCVNNPESSHDQRPA